MKENHIRFTRYIGVLGADDPEMYRINRLFKSARVPVVLACDQNGKRVGRKDANFAARASRIIHPGREVVFVECRVQGVEASVILDHHEPGDPGFEASPHDFVKGSSLGQAWQLLACSGNVSGVGDTSDLRGWQMLDGLWALFDSKGRKVMVPDDDIYAMAADHCLSYAYQGLCPGIDTAILSQWRLSNRALHQRRDPGDLAKEVSSTIRILQNAESREVGGENVAIVSPELPELAEASARCGIGYETCIHDKKSGMWKHKIASVGPRAIEAWQGEARQVGLVDIYGNPFRGYAGGYREMN